MGFDATFLQANQPILLGAAALLCGVALLHMLIMRMLRKRADESRKH